MKKTPYKIVYKTTIQLSVLTLMFLFGISGCQRNSPTPTLTAITTDTVEVTPIIPTPQPTTPRVTVVPTNDPNRIVVGSKEYTEQILLGKMMVILLKSNGYKVTDKTGLGGSGIVRSALENGEINVYAEYSGTSLSLYHNIPSSALPDDSNRTYQLAQSLDKDQGLVWLHPAKFNNTYTMMVRQDMVDQGVRSIDDLSAYLKKSGKTIQLCVDSEFFGREKDGLAALLEMYDIQLPDENISILAFDDIYLGLRDKQCDVAEGFSTDGRINAWGFTNLEDNRFFFPFYNPAPVMRVSTLRDKPEVADLLNRLFDSLDTATMQKLNARVDIGADGVLQNGDEESAEKVAQTYLMEQKLIKGQKITVATQPLFEHRLIGYFIADLLRENGYQVDDKIGLGGNMTVRAGLAEGSIDVALENGAEALLTFHELPVDALPNDPARIHELAKTLSQEWNFVWANRTLVNANEAVIVNSSLAEEINTIDDLAFYLNDPAHAESRLCLPDNSTAWPMIQAAYGLNFSAGMTETMSADDAYQKLADDVCQVAIGRINDGRNSVWSLKVLEDNRSVLIVQNPTPVIRSQIAKDNLTIVTKLNDLARQINGDVIQQLHAQLLFGADKKLNSGDEESAETIAHNYLMQARLLSEQPYLTIAYQDNLEQELLTQLIALPLAEQGFDIRPVISETVDQSVDITWQTARQDNFTMLESLSYANGTLLLAIADSEWTTLEQLADAVNADGADNITFCMTDDFRKITLPLMQKEYGLTLTKDQIKIFDQLGSELYTAIQSGECDIAEGRLIDIELDSDLWQPLVDTQKVFPSTILAPLIYTPLMTIYPAIAEKIDALTPFFNVHVMRQLSSEMRVKGNSADAIAKKYLCQNQLLLNCPVEATQTASAETPIPVTRTPRPTVVSAILPPNCQNLLLNSGFEEDTGWKIPATISTAEYSVVRPYTGKWSLLLGAQGRSTIQSYSTINQKVTLPQDIKSAELSFWMLTASSDPSGNDKRGIYIFTQDGASLLADFPLDGVSVERWVDRQFDLTEFVGQEILVHLSVVNDTNGSPTNIFFDDVQLVVCTE